MGTFRKSLKLGKKSRQIEENLKRLDKELQKTGALEESGKSEPVRLDETSRKFDWRREFFPEKDQYDMVNLLYEERQQKLKEAIGEEKIRIAEEVETLRETVEKKRELRQLQKVDAHLASIDVEFYKLRDDLVENINENMFPNIPAIEEKLDEILTVYGKLSERISEGFLNEPTGSAQGGDPLAKTDFVTFEQLKQHYSLFLDRISTQLATLGGGGEVELKYLDDVVGIATNPSAYDGKYLKYNHASRKFEFSDVGPIGITTELQTLNNVMGLGNTSNLGMSVGVSTFGGTVVVGGATTALVVNGDVRVVGVLTVGSGTVTIDGDNNTIGIGTVTLDEVKVSELENLTGDTGNFSGDVRVAGVLTAISLDSSNVSVAGSITGTTFYGDGSNLTGLSVGVGTTSISTESITVSGIVTAAGFNGPFFVEESIDDYAFYNIPTLYTQVGGNQYARTMVDSGGLQFNPGNNELWVSNSVRIGGATGIITATSFSGSGALLTNLPAGQLTGALPAIDGSQLTGIVFTGGDTVFTGVVTFSNNTEYADNKKATFGASADLQIYHDGAGSYISEVGQGDLVLNSNGTNIDIKFNNTEFGARFMDGGGSYIYHNNLLKLETLGTGATTYGTHYATSFSGSGASLTGITTSQITDFGNVVFGIGNSTSVNTTGTITASAFFGDGSALTGIATPAFVTQQIASLVDSAPTTLDTLNELAQALGDDPNFATTTTNLIGTKASLAGAAFTGSVSVTNGNLSIGSTGLFASRLYAKERIYVGDNEDIRLYQVETGNPVTLTESYLDLASTNFAGSMGIIRHGNRVTAYGGSLEIQNGGGQKSAVFNSGWSGVDLYYNSVLKFSTTDSGAGVVGILTATRFVGAATSNIIPFLYNTLGDLPAAASYHGAFAHVHGTGGAYYAHSGNWVRLVNYDIGEGNVSIGTANFTTTGNIAAGIVTSNSAEFSNLRLGTFGLNNIYAVSGPLYLDSDDNQVDIVNNLKVNGISTFSGRVVANDIVGLSSANFAGIVTAQSFRGDGSQLTGIGATNLNSLLDVNVPSPSAGQVLKWSGSEWQAAADLTGAGGTGIGLSDLSVTTAPVGVSSLSYDNTSGVFTYTPPSFAGYLSNTITQNVSMSNGYVFTYDSSATARFGSIGSNDYGDIFWGTDSSATGFHIKNNDFNGALYLTNTGTDGVYIRATATELGASFKANAEASLYYNNVLKFSTSGIGATVYGSLQINGNTNITGIITAQEFKGTFTGTANFASVAGVASTANYATESVTSGYAVVAGIASNLTGTPNITVGEINTTGGLFVGAGQTSSFGDRVTVRDDLSVEGSTPTLRIQDSDNAENYAYMQYDSSAGPALLFRTRAFSNTPHFIWQSEAGGGINNTQYLMYMQGGSPGAYNHGYVSLGSTTADERLHVGGSLKVTENITAAGIVTADVIKATTGFDGPFYVQESSDDNAFYNIPTLYTQVGGNQYVRTMVDTGALQFNPGINELWVSNNVRIGGATGIITAIAFSGSGASLTNIPTSIIAGTGITVSGSTGAVTISATATGISTTETLLTGNINAVGVVTATQFVGDGSGLTGIVAAGSGVVIQDEGGSVGTAGTINFVGPNVTATLAGGIADITVSNAYAQVAGVATFAQNLSGTPTINVNSIFCDDISITGSTPFWKLQDIDASQNYVYMEFDSSLNNSFFLRSRAFNNTPDFRIQSEAGGSINTNDYITVKGGAPGGATEGFVGLNTTSPNQRLTVAGNINATGFITATTFYGDGSNLTGVVAAGSGVVIQEEGSTVGTASTINFVGAAVTATFSGGVATVNISPAVSTGSGGKFIDNAAGIHTTSAVGVKTELPRSDFQVGSFGMQSGIGTFVAVVGTPAVVDQFNVSTNDFKTAEYTLHIQHANGIQSQKILVMQDGVGAYSNEYAIMHSSTDPLVSVASTISSGTCQLQVTPLTGTTGITTYRFSRGTLL